MKYSKNLLYIDLALIASIIPIFFILPIFMKLFLIVGLVLILLNKKYIKIISFLGVLFLFISFYQNFSFSSFAFFNRYIIFLTSLLVLGVVLQRLTTKINFWLKISPLLFLILSLVVYQNIYMLFYAVFEIFIFIFVLIYKKTDNIKVSIKESFKSFLIALPFVVLLFIFFPRYYMLKSKLGFQSNSVVSGFNEEMIVSDKSVINSNGVVFEVKFDAPIKDLYFRGNVLYRNIANKWKEFKYVKKDTLKCDEIITYRLKQYPTNKKYIYAYDLPIEGIKKSSFITPYYTLQSFKKIKNTINIKLNSCSKFRLYNDNIPFVAKEYNKNFNKKAQKLVENIKNIKNDAKKLEALKKLFIAQKIEYTLKPPKMDTLNIIDELFSKKRGYCVHFSAAFATLARIVGLPSRVVVGFLGKRKNMYKNYIVIRSSDAHAWVEVYLRENGWVRVDATSFAYKKIDNIQNTNKNVTNKIKKNNPIKKEELFLMYLRFTIEEWILNYDIFKQKQLFKMFENREFLYKFIAIFVLFLFGIIGVIYYFNKKNISIEDKLINKLIKKLNKKRKNQTIFAFLASFNNKKLDEINTLYNKIKFFKKDKNDIIKLKNLIDDFLKKG